MERIGLAIIASPTEHPAPPAHPERLDRLSLVLPELESGDLAQFVAPLSVTSREPSVLTNVHTADYVEWVQHLCRTGATQLDADTFLTGSSFDASCRVTWSLLSAVDAAFADGPSMSFVLGRPPGHHAEIDRGMGFCLFNHAAVAAQYALNTYHLRRIAIVDFDIHHGNGTQHAFYDRDTVLFVSTHQCPFFPGTGNRGETGRGVGAGFTLNIPFPAGTGDDDYLAALTNDIEPRLRQFRPELVIVSAGFDGHILDPLGGWELSGPTYGKIAAMLRQVAHDTARGRVVSVLEGGYDPRGNLDAIGNYIKGLAGQ
jgi:acetoin utilization deacetylase AcuC-like enzyme